MTTRSKLTAIGAALAVSTLYMSAPASAADVDQRIVVAQAGTGTGNAGSGNAGNADSTSRSSANESDGGLTGPKAEFKRLDVNQDGFIDSSEMRAHSGMQKNRTGYDTDKDGRVSSAEFDAQAGASTSGAHLPAGNATTTGR